VEKDEVYLEVLVTDLHCVLGANEAEVAAELGDEAPKVPQQRAMEVRLRVVAGQRQELQAIGVLELFEGSRVNLCHCW